MSNDTAQPGGGHEHSAGYAVELRNISKRFGPVLANDGVTLQVRRGTIHGVVGENGAGKSTAMKLLYGMLRPDGGQIFVNGAARTWHSPADAIRAGIGMVHQHFMLAGPFSVLDNILLGAEPARWGIIDRQAAGQKITALASRCGLEMDLHRRVEELPPGLQQRVEILKLLFRNADILILDEPTAVLTPQESNRLFANLRELRTEGKTVLLVTHKLREVLNFTDAVTVFRHGKVAGHLVTSQTDAEGIASLMVGRKITLNVQVPPGRPTGRPVLEASGLTLTSPRQARSRLAEVTLQVRGGEIVGIAGVEGNGQSELVQALLHPADPGSRTSGRVHIFGREVTDWPARSIRDLGVAVIPEDALGCGLLPGRPVVENVLLGFERSPRFSRFGFLRRGEIRRAATAGMERHDIRPRDPDLRAGQLSGGNQQKLVFAREFQRNPALVIACQPTRGVDVGASQGIHNLLVQARDCGAGVLLVSSDLDEVLRLSDHILVMYEGQVVAQFARGEATERELGLKMGGA